MEATIAARARPHRALAFAVIAAGLAAGCGKEAPPPPRPAPQVSVVTVSPQTIPFSPTFVAQTESSRQVNIVARVSGYLDRIAYREGEMVREGQLMFQLDPKPFVAQLNAARFTFVLAGLSHPHFRETLSALSDNAEAILRGASLRFS